MSQARQDTQKTARSKSEQDELRNSPMMVHLLDALQAGTHEEQVKAEDQSS